jgi:hypothetical protein
MPSLEYLSVAIIFGTLAYSPLIPTLAQEAEMSSPAELQINQQIDIQEVDIQIDNEIEIELEPEQTINISPPATPENDFE